MKEKKTSKKIEEAAEKATKSAKKTATKLSKEAEKVWKAAAKKIDEVSNKVSNVAWELAEEWELEEKFNKGAEQTKQAATWIKKWWYKSSTIEKITTILWIILLIWSLFVLSGLIGGILLLLFWILCITGYFDEFLDDICWKFTNSKKSKKK